MVVTSCLTLISIVSFFGEVNAILPLGRHARDKGLRMSGGMLRMPLRRLERPAFQLSFMQLKSAVAPMSSALPAVVDVYGTVNVGSPAQSFNVLLDTGSANLLLTSSLCRSVGCMAHKPFDATLSQTASKVEIHDSAANTSLLTQVSSDSILREVVVGIATGEAEGSFTQDTVCLGDVAAGACTKTSFVEMSKMTPEPWDNFPFDGVLGLGLPSASLAPNFNFLGNLAEGGFLKRNRFSVWLAGDHDTEDSELTFGDFPENRLGSEILWLPVVDLNTGQWRVELTDLSVSNGKLNLCGTQGCKAVFDTGTSVLGAPTGVLGGILERLKIKEDCSNYADLPPLGFAFRMFTLHIEKEDYVQKVGDKCYHQFLAIDTPPPKGPAVFLGNPFLKRYFAIFDRESLKVGLAFSVHNMMTGASETNAQAGQRLMVPAPQ